MSRWIVALVLGLGCAGAAGAQGKNQVKPWEQAPMPRPVTEAVYGYYLPDSLPQFRTREVWQYYGVDSAGRFRPRVINSPLGAYYLYNGAPYPWVTNQTTNYMPYAVD